jgi:nicotinic acid phosphoribosyltransferase
MTMKDSPQVAAHRIALSTDLYELTMGASYLALGMTGPATFSLFVRKLPAQRSFLVAAGVEEAIARLTSQAFDPDDAAYLVSTGCLAPREAEQLVSTRFTGDAWAVREGRAIFANEPLLECACADRRSAARRIDLAQRNSLPNARGDEGRAVRRSRSG